MEKVIWKNMTLSDMLLIVFFFFLPIYPIVSSVTLFVLVGFILFTGRLPIAIQKIKSDRILQIFILYYLLHLAGLIYTTNFNYGLADITTKVSFLVMPFLLAGLTISKETFERIKSTFIVCCLLSLSILFTWSFLYYQNSHDIYEFFYSRLSHNRHSTYITIYYTLALLFIQDKYYRNKNAFPSWAVFLSSVFFFTGIFLLSARTSTIVAFGAFVLYPIFIPQSSVFKSKKGIVHAAVIIVSAVIFYIYLGYSNRFTQVEQEIAIRGSVVSPDTLAHEAPNSTNIRLNLWSNSIELIKRTPVFGVGTGDIKEELVKMYTKNNYQYGVEHKPSPHNQFLHTTVLLGIIGLIVLLLVLILPLRIAFINRDWLFVFFLSVIILNCMTESLLEREAGILFFTSFYVLLYLRMRTIQFQIENEKYG